MPTVQRMEDIATQEEKKLRLHSQHQRIFASREQNKYVQN